MWFLKRPQCERNRMQISRTMCAARTNMWRGVLRKTWSSISEPVGDIYALYRYPYALRWNLMIIQCRHCMHVKLQRIRYSIVRKLTTPNRTGNIAYLSNKIKSERSKPLNLSEESYCRARRFGIQALYAQTSILCSDVNYDYHTLTKSD